MSIFILKKASYNGLFLKADVAPLLVVAWLSIDSNLGDESTADFGRRTFYDVLRSNPIKLYSFVIGVVDKRLSVFGRWKLGLN